MKEIESAITKSSTKDDKYNLRKLKKAYGETMKLRSQLISVIYDIENYIMTGGITEREFILNRNITSYGKKKAVKLVINEPLPTQRELTSAVKEHWTNMIHTEIAKKTVEVLPKFDKAMVVIEITAPRGTNNTKVWDVSNRAINLIINNLKGIFFYDDDFTHMACTTIADWGNVGKTVIKIYDFDGFFEDGCFERYEEI